MPSILQVLKQDHDKAKTLMEKLLETSPRAEKSRQKLFDQLKQDLTIHMQFEEKVFYPAVQRLTDDKNQIADARDEHREARQILNRLEKMEKSAEDWSATLEKLQEVLEHHIEDEEGEMFPEAEKEMAQEQDTDLVEQYRSMKKTAQGQAA